MNGQINGGRTTRKHGLKVSNREQITRMLRLSAGIEPVTMPVPLSELIVLPQVRKTFEEDDLEELKGSFSLKGQKTAIIVARFTNVAGLQEYVGLINRLQHARYQVASFAPSNNSCSPGYYVLVGGERRYRAAQSLTWTHLKADVYTDVPARVFPFIQLDENLHVRPPAHEEAAYLCGLLWVLRREQRNLSLGEFARLVSRKEGKIRDAWDYWSSPTRVRRLVQQGLLPYGAAVELSRYRREVERQFKIRVKTGQLIEWAERALNLRYNLQTLRDQLQADLEVRRSKQGSLNFGGMFQDDGVFAGDKRRRVVRREFCQRAQEVRGYIEEVLNAVDRGSIPATHSEHSPRRQITEMINLLWRRRATLRRLYGKLQWRAVYDKLCELKAIVELAESVT